MNLQINARLQNIIILATALVLGLFANGPIAILVGIFCALI